MSAEGEPTDRGEADALRAAFEAKAAAELDDAEAVLGQPSRVRSVGDPFAHVLLLKGIPGAEEEAAGRALAGPDGDAAASALSALGLEGPTFAAVSRPTPSSDLSAYVRRVRGIVEAVDPRIIVALDGTAAEDLAAALDTSPLPFGVVRRLGGRAVVAVDGLEASLGDERRKRRVWDQLRALREVADRE